LGIVAARCDVPLCTSRSRRRARLELHRFLRPAGEWRVSHVPRRAHRISERGPKLSPAAIRSIGGKKGKPQRCGGGIFRERTACPSTVRPVRRSDARPALQVRLYQVRIPARLFGSLECGRLSSIATQVPRISAALCHSSFSFYGLPGRKTSCDLISVAPRVREPAAV
jgi:hypothetical protein